MERAHRRHEPDGLILLASHLARDRTHALTAIDDFHKGRRQKSEKAEVRIRNPESRRSG
jgi:hypothetical protein